MKSKKDDKDKEKKDKKKGKRYLSPSFKKGGIKEQKQDPGDRIIIAQAIADHVSLVSSDRKFNRYKKNGLEFLYNKR